MICLSRVSFPAHDMSGSFGFRGSHLKKALTQPILPYAHSPPRQETMGNLATQERSGPTPTATTSPSQTLEMAGEMTKKGFPRETTEAERTGRSYYSLDSQPVMGSLAGYSYAMSCFHHTGRANATCARSRCLFFGFAFVAFVPLSAS